MTRTEQELPPPPERLGAVRVRAAWHPSWVMGKWLRPRVPLRSEEFDAVAPGPLGAEPTPAPHCLPLEAAEEFARLLDIQYRGGGALFEVVVYRLETPR